MTCYYPLQGWYSSDINPSGKRSITFSSQHALLDRPVSVACGKCIGCRSDHAMMWSVRCYHEASLHRFNSFITLTYSDENLPSDGLISKADLQKFFKRARKSGLKFRYFACGEYGDITHRPHYHILMFGQDFLHDAVQLNSDLYTSETLQNLWPPGHVWVGSVELHSIMYVAGYTQKKISDPDTFTLMSRKPLIGHDWLERFSDDIVRTGRICIDGREFVVPKRYLELKPELFSRIIQERKDFAASKFFDPVSLNNLEVNKKWLIRQKKEKI